jgi:ribose transport system permease protein/L-arabinose transport system permease protein
MSDIEAPAPSPAQAPAPAAAVETSPGPSTMRRVLGVVGVDNLSLILALVLVIAIMIWQSPRNAAGEPLFLSWQNLMNSLAQSIVIVGLLAIGETVVIVAGALDISVGAIAAVGSVTAAMAVGGLIAFIPGGSVQLAILVGILTGAILGIGNGLIVTVLNVNPIIATLGTFAAYGGLAFLVAPGGKPVGIITQPDFTWLGTGRLLEGAPVPAMGGTPWTGIPVVFVVLLIVAVLFHVIMRYTDYGRSIYAMGGNATAARLAGIDLRRMRIGIYLLSGAVAGLAGVVLTARTTSGNPVFAQSGFELQAITAVFLGGAATTGGKGTIVGTVLAVILVGVLNNGMNLLGVNTFYQRVALGVLLVGAVAIAQWRQTRAERARTRIAAAA